MRAIFGLVLVIGMGLAGFAVYMVKGYVSNQTVALQRMQAQQKAIVPTVDVVAVTRAIPFGEQITIEDVTTIKYAKDYLPEGVFMTKEELFPEGEDVARSVLLPVAPNEALTAAKVTNPGELAGISQRLRPGMRAFTIKVDVSTGVSGFLRPGHSVDIYWTGVVGGAAQVRGNDATHLIGTAIEIIGVDQSADTNRSTNEIARTVTVQVTPADVRSLTQAQSSGSLSLALVGANDTTTRADGIDAILLPEPEVEEAVVVAGPAPVEESCFINTRRGTETIQVPVQCTN